MSDDQAHKPAERERGLVYLPTSAHHQIAATILLDLVLTLGAGLGICIEPIGCLTVITALALPPLPPDEAVARLSIDSTTGAVACECLPPSNRL